jgi:hypothetical protein
MSCKYFNIYFYFIKRKFFTAFLLFTLQDIGCPAKEKERKMGQQKKNHPKVVFLVLYSFALNLDSFFYMNLS